MPNLYTHSGVFHADDVFSTALLRIIFATPMDPRGLSNPVTRTLTPPDNSAENIVYDIGGGMFDHHGIQEFRDAECLWPYAAFGKLWRHYGLRIIPDGYWVKYFDDVFVKQLDQHDAAGKFNILSNVFSSYNPTWDNEIPGMSDIKFFEAVNDAQEILAREFARLLTTIEGNKYVNDNYIPHSPVCVLPKFAPWGAVLIPSECKYVVFPSQRGGYTIQCVPVELDSHILKAPFPEQWRGKPENELPEGMRFCHASGFLCAVDTVERALSIISDLDMNV